MNFIELLVGIFSQVTLGLSLLFFSHPLSAVIPDSKIPPPQVITPSRNLEAEAPRLTATPPEPFVPGPSISTTPSRQTPPPGNPPLFAAEEEQKIPPAAPVPTSTAALLPPPMPTTTPTSASTDLNTRVRGALVNILCTGSGGPLRPASGSGVVIDPRGVILTNAHVGQFFLLQDYPSPGTIECLIRAGSPARVLYRAKLLYLPAAWISANAHKITQATPTGTGEYDFALLLITERTDPTEKLPANFEYVPANISAPPSLGEAVLLAGYPAGFLDGATIQTNLFISSAFTSVRELFNFDAGGPVELVSVAGTILSQSGASGGAVVEGKSGSLAGIIVTATLSGTTAERDLRAITLTHVDRIVRQEIAGGLGGLLSGSLPERAATFAITTAPSLRQALIDKLEGR